MDTQIQTNERRVHDEVQKMIGGLLKFDNESRVRIYKTVGTFFGFDSPPTHRGSLGQPSTTNTAATRDARTPTFSRPEELSPKDFLFQKQPNTDVDRVACLAFYLTHYRDTPHFKTIDISSLNTEAAQIKFSNTAYAVANATNSGLLVQAGKGAKQLSAAGERYVEALPDRAAAKEILAGMRQRRGRKKSSGNNFKSPD